MYRVPQLGVMLVKPMCVNSPVYLPLGLDGQLVGQISSGAFVQETSTEEIH